MKNHPPEKTAHGHFITVRRQDFRRVFQPSRIVIGVLQDHDAGRTNLIALCFSMHCSYKPPMMSFAIHKNAHSFGLLEKNSECVLAVPGERLAAETLFCGVESGRDLDKVRECKFDLCDSVHLQTPGLSGAIANIELRIASKVRTGDHLTAICEVLRFAVSRDNNERCLISVGPRTEGYTVLAHKGMHRIAVVQGTEER